MAALELAASDSQPQLGRPHQVAKVYYDQGISFERIEAVHRELLARGLDSPYEEWLRDRPFRRQGSQRITTRVPVADFFEVRDAALRAHASQVDPDGWFFAMPRDVEREVWPHEDFELARTGVPVELPETDLFAGLR
jgi:mycothiol S-conjugate amidase